ncbi:MAG: NAD(P)H-binding protein [Caldimonas sp.]
MAETSATRREIPTPRRALVVGATGLIGRELLARLLGDPGCASVTVISRKPLGQVDAQARLTVLATGFERLPEPFPTVDDVFIALGTTIKVAGSEAAFRAVDLDLVVQVARVARAAGASRLGVVSALGADAGSRVFYNRVKGEMQAAVCALGYESVVIAQPSLLIGDRAALGQPVRRFEALAGRLAAPVMALVPKGVRPIAAADVAAALLSTLRSAGPGVHLLSSGSMQGASAS